MGAGGIGGTTVASIGFGAFFGSGLAGTTLPDLAEAVGSLIFWLIWRLSKLTSGLAALISSLFSPNRFAMTQRLSPGTMV